MIENEVIKIFCNWLVRNGWTIESIALDRNHGDDIRAKKGGQLLLVEAKGARGNPKSSGVVRLEFDTGQIKDHLGKAIVKALELKVRNPSALIVIAHPATEKIFKVMRPLCGHLVQLEISCVFVRPDGEVEWVGANLADSRKAG